MPRSTSINSLPAELQDQLRVRLLATGFAQFEEHSEWLRREGFSISKSAIHRYATAHATAIMAQQRTDSSLSLVESRIRCLEIVATGFAQFEEHSEWLRREGFSISKSAIHRYATAHATAIMAQQRTDSSLSLVESRIRCLEIASSLAPSTTADLMRDAEELLKWVYRP